MRPILVPHFISPRFKPEYCSWPKCIETGTMLNISQENLTTSRFREFGAVLSNSPLQIPFRQIWQRSATKEAKIDAETASLSLSLFLPYIQIAPVNCEFIREKISQLNKTFPKL